MGMASRSRQALIVRGDERAKIDAIDVHLRHQPGFDEMSTKRPFAHQGAVARAVQPSSPSRRGMVAGLWGCLPDVGAEQ
jgi:hypothetical protein